MCFTLADGAHMMNKSVVYGPRLEKAVKGELPLIKQRQPSIRFDSNDKYFKWVADIEGGT